MQLKNIKIKYISHCTFILEYNNIVLITDPYFCGGFEWAGNVETHLERSPVRPEDIVKCDYIFVSHEHGDHFDIDAIKTITAATGAKVIAPQCLCDILAAAGIREAQLLAAEEEQQFTTGGFSLITLGEHDSSFYEDGICDKYSLVIKTPEDTIWFSGDNHVMPPNLKKYSPTTVICWTVQKVLEQLQQVCPDLENFITMHCDRHEPGKFWCSKNESEEQARAEKCFPKAKVHALNRIQTI
ncbi:MAG: MBL fold metallo-hydrolase [Victivallaceae bacterium]|nr:MBL fold metallo-hydrolase [Victivallaceae bacterium]